MASRKKMSYCKIDAHLASLCSEAPSVILPVGVLKAEICDETSVLIHVASQARQLPACQGMSVSPLRRFSSNMNRPAGSFTDRMLAYLISSFSWWWCIDLPARIYKRSTRSWLRFVALDWHQHIKPTATRITSSWKKSRKNQLEGHAASPSCAELLWQVKFLCSHYQSGSFRSLSCLHQTGVSQICCFTNSTS